MYKVLSIKNWIIGLLVVFVALVVFSKPAFADFELGVYPPLTTINTEAPYTVDAPISIQNSGDNPVDLDIQIKPFRPSAASDGTPEYTSDFGGADAAIKDKIILTLDNGPVTSLTLPPGATRTLSMNIDIPQDEPDGEYYFSIIFVSKGLESDQNTSSGVSGGIATNVLLHIGQNKTPSGTVSDFSTPFLRTSGPIPISILVTNTGSTFFAPHGTITIKNTFGQTVGAFNLLPVNILRSSNRYIPANVDTNGVPDPQILWNEKVLAGVYSIQLKMKFSDNGPFFDQTIYFLVIPWAAVAAVIGISLISLAVVLRVRRRIM